MEIQNQMVNQVTLKLKEKKDDNATPEQYYTSGLWEHKVNSSLSAIGEIDQQQTLMLHPHLHTPSLSP